MPEHLACAYCRQRPVDDRCRPFCSPRCRMADLGRWLGGDYRIAGEPADPAGHDELWGAPAEPESPHDDH